MARHERSAGFIIYHATPHGDGRPPAVEYLLLDYGRYWDFAKGHVEAGEDDLAAAVRELAEETGITNARVIPGFRHEIVYFFRDRKKGLIRKTVVFYLGEVTTRDVEISHEHVDSAFLPYEQAVRQATYPSARELLRGAHTVVTAIPPQQTELGATH